MTPASPAYTSPGHRLVVTAVRVAGQLSKAADRFLQPHGLTLAQFNLLVVLASEPEGLPQSGVGARLVVSRANVTGLVRRMKARGLCRTSGDPADRRIKRLQITPAGGRLFDAIYPRYIAEVRRITRGLSLGTLGMAANVLDRLESDLNASR